MLATIVGSARPPRLRTVFCTRGGLFGAMVLSRLRACDRIEICAIVRSSRTFHPEFGFLRGALAYLRRSDVAYTLYLFWATTIADVLCGLALIGGVQLRAAWRGVPLYTTRDINDAEGLRFLRGCEPDLIVSAFFDQRLREAALALPACGCVNIHPSLLPYFRGVDPVLHARLQCEDLLGVTVHRMALGLDEGNIISQRTVVTPHHASIFATTALLFCAGAELLVAEIDRIANGVMGTAQSAGGSYQSWPTREAVRAVRGIGYPLARLTDLFWICQREIRPVTNTELR